MKLFKKKQKEIFRPGIRTFMYDDDENIQQDKKFFIDFNYNFENVVGRINLTDFVDDIVRLHECIIVPRSIVNPDGSSVVIGYTLMHSSLFNVDALTPTKLRTLEKEEMDHILKSSKLYKDTKEMKIDGDGK